MTAPETIRRHLVEHLGVLANADAQLRYEREVPHVPVYVELIESFFDSYFPDTSAFDAAFSSEERKCLAEISRTLKAISLEGIHSVSELLATERWKHVIQQAREAGAILTKNIS